MSTGDFIRALLEGKLRSQGGSGAQARTEYSPEASQVTAAKNEPWYRQLWFHLLLLLVVPYLQVPLMWFQKVFSARTRLILTAVGLVLTIAYLSSQSAQTPNSSSTSTDSAESTGDGNRVGAARVEYEFEQPRPVYQDITVSLEPSYEMMNYAKKMAGDVFEIAARRKVDRIELAVTVIFPDYSYKDDYGKKHNVAEERVHSGDIIVTDVEEIKKYTKEAYVTAKRYWYVDQLLDFVDDKHRRSASP